MIPYKQKFLNDDTLQIPYKKYGGKEKKNQRKRKKKVEMKDKFEIFNKNS